MVVLDRFFPAIMSEYRCQNIDVEALGEFVEKTTFLGLIVGFGAIIFGQILEGGHLSDLIQGTAALIVLGGTLGAVLVSTPLDDLQTGLTLTKEAFFSSEISPEIIVSDMLSASKIITSGSIADLEKKTYSFTHPEMRRIFRLVADGIDGPTLRELVESQMTLQEERLHAGAKIWIDAGGYAPTIGIIGAVLGLIHVMANLSDTSMLGAGIAVAFVATIYGVASANIFFLPIGNKLKRIIQKQMATKEMILEGAVAILEGKSSYVVKEKLRAFNPAE